MLKVITGAPRSGKSYYALREIILKNFTFNERFHEWQPLSEDPPTIITNIDGLKIPHVNLNELCQELGVDVAHLCTLRVFDNQVLTKYPKVVLLIDEAQSYFPSDFKSKETDRLDNTFFFFEYHGHRPIDIYLIGQLWISFAPRIVRLAEYQIEAVRRHLSFAGELRYHFMSGFDIINRVTLKPDRRIFALYKSSEGELHVTKPPRPYRFYAIAITVALGVILYSLYSLFTGDALRYGSKLKQESTKGAQPSPAAGPQRAGAVMPAGSSVDAPAQAQGNVLVPGQPAFKPSGLADPTLKAQQYAAISMGGMWIGDRLVAVDLNGQVVPVADFPYSYQVQGGGRDRRVVAHVPVGVLQSIRPTFWLDGQGLASEPVAAAPTGGQIGGASSMPGNAANSPPGGL